MRSRERLSILPKRVLWKDHARMKLWAWDKKNLPSIGHAIRTAVAATASVGALEANYFAANLVAFALAIVFVGLLSIAFRLEKTAYRYASVTLAIVVLIPRSNPPWSIALHRFIEVSVGIIVALAVVALWPERQAVK
jgi:uncharacterized membrane protein YgaE (UPF0421/DUF939 family)